MDMDVHMYICMHIGRYKIKQLKIVVAFSSRCRLPGYLTFKVFRLFYATSSLKEH